ncbi:putative SWAP/Surp superfamily protein [Arabidopsis thaliana]|uniref:SURP motif domain-containing protein n=2 Tax=Arabidopsis thaliana TaxID=3702 RepID=A0A654ECC6_ARATH|nr:SWAP/surp RNA-binding domain protein [Arabidopsis thaliana]AEE29668.2 SWAP/surp RNA-binding domain protein [Arabidopsis thaliana]CAA0216543.1 unnamed protein product [Arabidopsis thaliana]VYS46440.1 unnamed protein product [Arabidopsis thaliana]|eukprot:NP_001319032.1 SWAP/surp RNA-binding domain protein [Arabidopsis thaliana]
MSLIHHDPDLDGDVDPEAEDRDNFHLEEMLNEWTDEPPIRHDVYPESDGEGADDSSDIHVRRGDGFLYQKQSFFSGVAFKEAVIDYALRTGHNPTSLWHSNHSSSTTSFRTRVRSFTTSLWLSRRGCYFPVEKRCRVICNRTPADVPPRTRYYADSSARLVFMEGPEMERKMMTSYAGNPKYSFFWSSDRYHAYYQKKLAGYRAQNYMRDLRSNLVIMGYLMFH